MPHRLPEAFYLCRAKFKILCLTPWKSAWVQLVYSAAIKWLKWFIVWDVRFILNKDNDQSNICLHGISQEIGTLQCKVMQQRCWKCEKIGPQKLRCQRNVSGHIVTCKLPCSDLLPVSQAFISWSQFHHQWSHHCPLFCNLLLLLLVVSLCCFNHLCVHYC